MDHNKLLPYTRFINFTTQGLSRWLAFMLFVLLLPGCGGGGGETNDDASTQNTGAAKERFLDAAEDEEVDIALTINLIDSSATRSVNPKSFSARPPLLTGASQAIGSRVPQMYEFTAVAPSGTPIKGVIYGLGVNIVDEATGELAVDDFAASIRNKEMRLRARVKKVNGEFVLVGNATTTPNPGSPSAEQRFQQIAWTIIAVESSTMLTGPQPGRVFHYYGDANARAVCNGNLVAGMFRIANANRVVGTLIGMLEGGKVCNTSSFAGKAKLAMDAVVVDTHIGPLLSSEGFLAPKGKFANAVETFGLAIAEQLSGEGDIIDVKTNDKTRIIDPEAAEQFVGFYKEYQALVFKSLKGSLAELESGDFIVSKPRPKIPNGFLRKVFQIQTINGYVVVRTENALISDILESANIQIDRRYTLADVEEANAWFGIEEEPPAADDAAATRILRKQTNEGDLINIKVNKVVFDQDGDHSSKDDQVLVTGNLAFNPRVVLELDCSGFACTKPDFVAKFVLEESSKIKVSGKIKKTLHKSFNLPPAIWLPPITAGPLIFTPKFVVQLNVDGTLGASIVYSASQEFTLEAGVDFSPADGWGTISEFERSFTSEPPEYSGEIGAKAELAVRAEFKLYGIAGVFADLGGYVEFEASVPRSPIWQLYGGFASSVGVDLDIFVWQADFSEDLISRKWTVDEAPNQPPEPPTISQPYPKYMEFVEKDGDVTIDVSSFDPEQGENCCIIELESDVDGFMQKVPTWTADSFSYVFDSVGIHTITATVTDDEGEVSSSEIEVDVRDRLIAIIGTPQTRLNFPSVVVAGEYADLELILSDDRGVGDALECCSVEWTVAGEFIGRTNGDADNPMHHTIRHRFTVPDGATRDGFFREVAIEANFDIADDGLSGGTITRSEKIEILAGAPKIVNSLSEISKTFPDGNKPPYTADEVIYSVTLSDPELCNNVSWFSSVDTDGVSGFLGFGTQSGDVVTLRKTFDTHGVRTITVNMTEPGCDEVSASVKTKVEDNAGGMQVFTPATPF